MRKIGIRNGGYHKKAKSALLRERRRKRFIPFVGDDPDALTGRRTVEAWDCGCEERPEVER